MRKRKDGLTAPQLLQLNKIGRNLCSSCSIVKVSVPFASIQRLNEAIEAENEANHYLTVMSLVFIHRSLTTEDYWLVVQSDYKYTQDCVKEFIEAFNEKGGIIHA